MTPTANTYRYYAFISYSRKDSKAAAWLQRRLEWFRFPVKLVPEDRRPPHPRYVRPIYRDKTSLEVTDEHYWTNIRRALEESRYLIVLCSPQAATSEPVNMEVAHFLDTHGGDASLVAPVIVSGNVTSVGADAALCPALAALGDSLINRNLPTMVPDTVTAEQDAWEAGFVSLVSYLLHLDRRALGDHIQRETKRQARVLRRWLAAVGVLSVLAVAGGIYAEKQRQRAVTAEAETQVQLEETQRQKTRTTNTLADARHAQAVEQVDKGENFEALTFAFDAHRLRPDDAASSALLFSLLTHDVPSAPAFAPIRLAGQPQIIIPNLDGTMLISAGLGLPMQVWNLADGKKLAEIPASSGENTTGGFTADGRGVFHQTDKNLLLRIWSGLPDHVPEAEIKTSFQGRWLIDSAKPHCIAATFDPMLLKSAETILSGSENAGNTIVLGNPEGWEKLSAAGDASALSVDDATHKKEVKLKAMSRDGQRVATADDSGLLAVWDARMRTRLNTSNLPGAITALEFHRDGRRILAGTKDKTVAMFETDTGRRLFQWTLAEGACPSVSWSTSGAFFAANTAGDDGWVQGWDSQSTRRIFYHKLGHESRKIQFDADGGALFCQGPWAGFTILDIPSRRQEEAHVLNRFDVTQSGWNPVLGLAWLLDESNTLRIYRTDASRLSCLLLPLAEKADHAEFSPDGKRLLITTEDPARHQVWDVEKGLPLHLPVSHPADVTTAGFTADENTVVIACRTGEVALWDAETGGRVRDLSGSLEEGIANAQLSANRRWLTQTKLDFAASAVVLRREGANANLEKLRKTIQTEITRYDLVQQTKASSAMLTGQFFHVMCADDGNTMLLIGSSSVGGAVQAMLVRGAEIAGETALDGVSTLKPCISADGRYAVVPDGQAAAKLLGLSPFRVIALLPHPKQPSAAVFSRDGSKAATASEDGTAQVWACKDGRPLGAAIRHPDGSEVHAVNFSPDGHWLVTAGGNEAVVWDAATGRRASINLTASDELRHAEFSPDGKWLALCGDEHVARMWEWLPGGSAAPPGLVRDAVALLSEKVVASDEAEPPASGWQAVEIRDAAHSLPPGPWRGAIGNLFLPASCRSITPTAGISLGADRLRQAQCHLLLGDHTAAVHHVRLALKLQPDIPVPPELECTCRLITGTAVDATTIAQRPGEHLPGAGKKPGARRAGSGATPHLRWCPPGRFMMGADPANPVRWGNETWREVFLTRGYWIGETEVTQKQWREVMGQTLTELAHAAIQDETRHHFRDTDQTVLAYLGFSEVPQGRLIAIEGDDYPVYWVSQDQAREFCRKLTEMERASGKLDRGWSYRLPTEAEWEYACRAAKPGSLYEGEFNPASTNFNAPELDTIAWYGGNSCHDYPAGQPGWDCKGWEGRAYAGNRAGPRQVAQKKPNAWGLHDMLGNVHEWTSSFENDALTLQRVNPERTKSTNGEKAIFRGGSWNNFAVGCRNSSRSTELPALRSHYLGFRVVLAPEALNSR